MKPLMISDDVQCSKFFQSRSDCTFISRRTQAVRNAFNPPVIGAKWFLLKPKNILIDCFYIAKKCGIDAAL